MSGKLMEKTKNWQYKKKVKNRKYSSQTFHLPPLIYWQLKDDRRERAINSIYPLLHFQNWNEKGGRIICALKRVEKMKMEWSSGDVGSGGQREGRKWGIWLPRRRCRCCFWLWGTRQNGGGGRPPLPPFPRCFPALRPSPSALLFPPWLCPCPLPRGKKE